MSTGTVPILKVKRPRAILFDIIGTIAKTSFIDRTLLPYIRTHIRIFLEENWSNPSVQIDIENLRQQSKCETNAPMIPIEGEPALIIDSVIAYVHHALEHNNESKAMITLRLHMWFDAFQRERLMMPVYSDAAEQLNRWHHDYGIVMYVLSNGWSQATKRFLSRTNYGDLNNLIEEHFDTSIGDITKSYTFERIVRLINEPAEQVLYLTKNAIEGRAALNAGLNAILVMTHRRTIDMLDDEAKKMTRVRTLNDLQFE